MSRETVEWAKTVHLHNGPDGTTADDLIVLRGELAVMRGRLATALDDLEKANERARTLAADVSRLAQENAAQALALSKANHTADELRRQLYIEARADEGRAMRVLRAASTQAGITVAEAINRAQVLTDNIVETVIQAVDVQSKARAIIDEYVNGRVSIDEALGNLNKLAAEYAASSPVSPPLTLTDRGADGDGYYCEYPEMVME